MRAPSRPAPLEMQAEKVISNEGKRVLCLNIGLSRFSHFSDLDVSKLVSEFENVPDVKRLYHDVTSDFASCLKEEHLQLCSRVSEHLKRVFLPEDSREVLKDFQKQVPRSQIYSTDVVMVIRGQNDKILSLPWELLAITENDPGSFAGLRFRIIRHLIGFATVTPSLESIVCGVTGASRIGSVPNPSPSRCHLCAPTTLSAIDKHKRLFKPSAFVLAAESSNNGFCLDHDEVPIRSSGFNPNCPSDVKAAQLVSLLASRERIFFSAFLVCGRSVEAFRLLRDNRMMHASLGLKFNMTKAGVLHLLNWLLHSLAEGEPLDRALLEYRLQAFRCEPDDWWGSWRDWWLPSLYSKSMDAKFNVEPRAFAKFMERWGRRNAN